MPTAQNSQLPGIHCLQPIQNATQQPAMTLELHFLPDSSSHLARLSFNTAAQGFYNFE